MMYVGIFEKADNPSSGLCGWIYGQDSCNQREIIYNHYVGICALYVFGLFYASTYHNKSNAPQLKRLTQFATHSAIATFGGIICLGSSNMGGSENSVLHIADMIYFVVLILFLSASSADDSPIAGRSTSPILTNLKFLNPKALVLFIGVGVLIKMFMLTDFMDLSNFLVIEDAPETDLSRGLLSLMALLMFEIGLTTLYAFWYGDATDQLNYVVVVLLCMAIAGLSIIPNAKYYQDGLILKGTISFSVFVLLGLFSIWQHRKDGRQREGYQSIDIVV